jgi:AhpD family alkylhydroperoxidase
MENRIDLKQLEPEAYQALFGLEKYILNAKINPILSELIRIRASQINGCTYCIAIHTKDARKLNVSEQKLFALPAWKESPIFSSEERVVLSMTDEITLISQKGLSTKTYKLAQEIFDDNTIAKIIMLIGTINIWNRIAVATKMVHPLE